MLKNILLIDDSDKITSLLKLFLFDAGNIGTIHSANQLQDAEEMIALKIMDLVILDIQFEKGNGMKLLKRIKLYYPATTVIVLTNHSDDFFKELSEQAGADHFLDKSEEFEKIPGIISQLSFKALIQ